MADPFSPEVSDRICKHMNKDHGDAVALYAQVYGQIPEATGAQLLKIDAAGMDLQVQVGEASQALRIAFDHTLVDAKDAHVTLVEMVNQVRGEASDS
jgi:putative heme iron utilization protein